jgi:hypothetical protein
MSKKNILLSMLVVSGFALFLVSTSAASFSGDKGDRGNVSRDGGDRGNYSDDIPYPKNKDATRLDRVEKGRPRDWDNSYYQTQERLRNHR